MQIFDDLQDQQFEPNVRTFTSIINACQTCGNDWQTGLDVFGDMESYGECCALHMQVATDRFAAQACSHGTTLTCARGTCDIILLCEFLYVDVRSDIVQLQLCYDVLVMRPVQRQLVLQASNQMRMHTLLSCRCVRRPASGSRPCMTSGRWSLLMSGLTLWPTTLLSCPCHASFTEALDHAGIKPNAHAYSAIMSLCQKAGQWQRAMQVFREMEAVDVRIDVVAYNSAIAACAKGEDWEQAWAVFNSKS